MKLSRALFAAILSIVAAACGSPTNDAGVPLASETSVGSACGADVVPNFSLDWQPLPAASELTVSAETQALRDQILGADALDPEQVNIWWYGVASFIAAVKGHLFLFDAWEIVGLHQDYAPIGREELAALKPEVIFIGHGHFDHAGDMGYIAGRSGATVFGGSATCTTAKEQAARDGNQDAFSCHILGDAISPAPGTIQKIKVWQDVEPVQVLRHTHSEAQPEDLAAGGVPLVYAPQLTAYLLNINTSPQEIAWFLQSLDDEIGNSPEGGVWAYHLKVDDFTLLWHDSAGPIAEGKAFADQITCALDSFPGCVDVQLGTIVGFGAVTSGLRDVGQYARNAHPQVHLPNHHDAWAPIIGPGAEAYEAQWRAEVETFPNPPEIDYLDDPEDYMRQRSYNVNNPRWAVPMAGSSCAEAR